MRGARASAWGATTKPACSMPGPVTQRPATSVKSPAPFTSGWTSSASRAPRCWPRWPDPNLLAGLPEPLLTNPHRRGSALLASRREHLGPSLSVSYRRPLTIVRGWKQFLYDEDGLRYLDGVNNVAHLGHGHPRVVQAIRE